MTCTGPAPPLANNTWPDTCKDAALGRECKGSCAPGFSGEPTAVCTKKGWSANGGCKPMTCDEDKLPAVANATWDCGGTAQKSAERHGEHHDDDHDHDDDHHDDRDLPLGECSPAQPPPARLLGPALFATLPPGGH